ncbi:DUF6878 family protein [Ruegeria sp.]|uniref:DUF6878 family protein n=1 Tax=Ruegeria sp. TaxID=1879320 RepID=UPI003B00E165
MTSERHQRQPKGEVKATGTTEVIIPKAPDWAKINARWEAEREKTRERLRVVRAELLAALRALGVQEIEGQYDGYADSGNVQGIAVTPVGVTLGGLENRLEDFIWGMAHDLHPGFEINDGGEGALIWNVVEDRIDVAHAELYTARNEYSHEDI